LPYVISINFLLQLKINNSGGSLEVSLLGKKFANKNCILTA
jgi:hypothetical protein